MPNELDLSLPAQNDSAANRQKFNPHTKQCCAIYFHVHLPLTAISDLIALCNSQLMTSGSDVVCPAPHSDKIGRPLRSSLETHRKVGVNTVFHPAYYIAVVEKDFEQYGVLLVSTGTNSDPAVRKMWVPAASAGSAFANLQISHLDWSKLEQEFQHLQNIGDNDSDGQDSDDAMDAPFTPDYVVGIYILQGVSQDAVLNALGSKSAAHAHTFLPYGIQGYISPCASSPAGFKLTTAPIISDNPSTGSADCPLGPYDQRALTFAITEYMTVDEGGHGIHDSMFLLADQPDVEQDGLLLVKIDRSTSNPVVFEAQRIPASNPETLQIFNKIDTGMRPFHIAHWSFVLQCKVEEDAWRIAELMDPETADRVHDDEKFLIVSAPEEHVNSSQDPMTVDTAVKPWPVVCHHERFRHNLHRKLFLYAEPEVKGIEDEVTIVDTEWEPSEETVAEGVQGLNLKNGTRVMRVKAGEAYEVCCKLADGAMEWPVMV
ncbi:MAG: hypothetical protein Q9162_005723 [Coniocarpon cinnabarinum]